MMPQPKVSIVVPIYNVERYLCKCVDSLLAQSLADIEILLVDDGSPDNSGKIADEYAHNETRVKVFHQKNAGLGPARNIGILHASGEYVGFVDSDDWVDSDMFSSLYEAARQQQADIAVGGHRDMVDGEVRIAKPHPLAGKTLHGSDEIMPVRNRLLGHAPSDTEVEAFPMRVWTAIYRNEFLKRDNLLFEEILSEDTIFNLTAYRAAQTITFINNTDYCYRMDNQPSIMRSFSTDKLSRYEAFVQRIQEIAKTERESHNECVMRARRMAIDYCRLYAGLIVNSNLSLAEKVGYLRKLSISNMCVKYSSGYPLETLPTQQRVFQKALIQGHVWKALVLMQARQVLKKKVWK